MSTVVAFRRRDESYLLVQSGAWPAWLANPSVEFLGDVEGDSFGSSVAAGIDDQIAARKFALVTKEEFYFSAASFALRMRPGR